MSPFHHLKRKRATSTSPRQPGRRERRDRSVQIQIIALHSIAKGDANLTNSGPIAKFQTKGKRKAQNQFLYSFLPLTVSISRINWFDTSFSLAPTLQHSFVMASVAAVPVHSSSVLMHHSSQQPSTKDLPAAPSAPVAPAPDEVRKVRFSVGSKYTVSSLPSAVKCVVKEIHTIFGGNLSLIKLTIPMLH
jgi:hypothetical protein